MIVEANQGAVFEQINDSEGVPLVGDGECVSKCRVQDLVEAQLRDEEFVVDGSKLYPKDHGDAIDVIVQLSRNGTRGPGNLQGYVRGTLTSIAGFPNGSIGFNFLQPRIQEGTGSGIVVQGDQIQLEHLRFEDPIWIVREVNIAA